MTNSNSGDRIAQVENLVLSLAQAVNQLTQHQQITDQRLSQFIEISNQNFEQLSQSQRDTSEAVRSVAESVDRLSAEVIPQLALEIADNSSRTASVEAAVERMNRILDHLMRRDRDQNGGQA